MKKKNYLIFLFIEFDNYIYNAFKYVLERKPQLLEEKKIDFKLKDLEFYIMDKDGGYVYSFLAEKEIERKLYGDYMDIFLVAFLLLMKGFVGLYVNLIPNFCDCNKIFLTDQRRF